MGQLIRSCIQIAVRQPQIILLIFSGLNACNRIWSLRRLPLNQLVKAKLSRKLVSGIVPFDLQSMPFGIGEKRKLRNLLLGTFQS